MPNLDVRLLAAHDAGDRDALIALYHEASESTADPARSAFYLTHAWVFALDAGDPRASDYHQRLAATGRAD